MNTDHIADRYRHFAEHEAAGTSPTFVRWSETVAATPAILQRLAPLTTREQQPNLLFAAARWLGAEPGDGDALRDVVEHEWDRLVEIIHARRTQTNEAARCAVLLPVLAALPQPLALLEVGASAGLCLYPDRYSYRYAFGEGRTHDLDPATGPSTVAIDCELTGEVPLPKALPQVVWRTGIDLNPLDVTDPDTGAWLENLIWPEHDDRRTRLHAAVELARTDPPRIVRGDLLQILPDVAAQAPEDATLVVFHSQVLSYVHDDEARRRFAKTVADLPGHWVSNESNGVFDLPFPSHVTPPEPGTCSVVALDGQPVALGHGHGRSLSWL